jgi:hypothetical protein
MPPDDALRYFGTSVSIDGNTLVVGAYGGGKYALHDGTSGQLYETAYLFRSAKSP